jgi:long-subunit fatty acid transport protein
VNRIPTSDQKASGPCYSTTTPRPTKAEILVPLYDLDDQTTISRAGVSAAYRAAPGLSIGASVYYLKEERIQTSVVGDASSDRYTDPFNPTGTVSVDGSEVGFELGVQYSPADAFRIGLVWSSEVKFGNENKSNSAFPALRTTVLPMRVGVGVSWAFQPRWSLGVDTVFLGTSKAKDGLNFSDIRPLPAAWKAENWRQDDTWEVRVGLEWAVVQTRTTAFTARLGGWVQTPSDLRFDYGDATVSQEDQYYFDALSVTFPKDKDDPFTHATFGFGLVSQKKWQFDVGADYEFKTSTFVASGLIGYTF